MFFRRKPKTHASQTPPPPSITIDPFRGDPVARRLSELLGERNWPEARQLIERAGPDEFEWLVDIASTKSNIMDWIDDAVHDDPDPTLPMVVKGIAAVSWAWEARGTGWSKDVPENAWATVNKRLLLAENTLDDVLERDPRCLPALTELITLSFTRSLSLEEKWRRFHAATDIDPLNPYAHSAMLIALTSKWGGSSAAMFAFARERGALAPDGHELKALIVEAHIEEWLINDRSDSYLERADVGDEISAAAHATIWHPDYQRSRRTQRIWNAFAYAFSVGDRFAEAQRCFEFIGDDLVTRQPWSFRGDAVKTYLKLRTYTTVSLDKVTGARGTGA